VSGVTNADLRKRDADIMTERGMGGLNFSGGRLLVVAGSLAVMVPSVLGQGSAIQSGVAPQVAGTESKAPVFAVATIKPNNKNNGWRLEFTPDGFTARGVFLRQVIQEAYGVYEENRMYGGPTWLTSERFDIEAKIDSADAAGFRDFSLDQRRFMLQRLLADRFKLTIHRETKELPAYALLVAKSGPKLHESKPDTIYHSQIKGVDGLVTRSGRGYLDGQGFSTTALAQLLYPSAGILVVDKTGLTGSYDFSLHWTPDDVSTPMAKATEGGTQEAAASDFSGPSLFTALQEQLGLKLVPMKFPLEVIVIDHVEMPSEN
jgi:uncharacterized protein (TIGR03435 family)